MKSNINKDNTGRNYGVDLLRIVSMMMVTLLHVLGQGGILAGANPEGANYKLAWFLEAAAFCAANCYALISGYVGVKSNHKYANIVTLTLEVMFYNLLIALGFKYYMPDVLSEGVFFRACFPFVYNQYWYFTAYFCVFFFIPFMNKMLLSLGKGELKTLMATIVFLFTLIPTIFSCDVFNLGWGYSSIWIGALYLFGGCLRLLDFSSWSKGICFIVYLGCVILSWCNKLFFAFPKNAFLINYISPTILIAAAALLLLFSKINMGKISSAVTAFFAPLAFGVFLLHTHPLVWNNWLLNRYVSFAEYSPIKMVQAVFAATLAIWFVCSLADFVRNTVFKILHIKKMCILIENKIKTLLK